MATPKVAVELSAVDRYSQAFGSFTGGLQQMERRVGALDSAFARLPFFGGAAAGVLGGGAISAAIKKTINDFDELNKAAQKVGVSVESLSALNYAGALSDVSFESLTTGLKKLSVNAADAAKGTGEARDAFNAMGISVKDGSGAMKTADALLGEIADKFASYEDGVNKTALAVKLFGRAGADLIPLLNAGRRGLGDMRAEAEAFGVIVGGDAAKAAEAFNDNLTRIGTIAKGFGVAIANDVIPWVKRLTDEFIEAKRQGIGFFEGLRQIGTRGTNPQTNIRNIDDEIGKLRATMGRDADIGNPTVAKAYADKIAELERARAYFVARSAASAMDRAAGLGDIRDARDRMLASAGLGPAPGLADDAKVKAGAKGLTDLERFAERIQRERMAEYDKYAREVTPDDLDAQAAEQAKAAIKAAEDRAKRLQSLYGQTAQGKHEALVGNLQFIESMRAAGQVTDLQAQAIVEDLYAVKDAGEEAFGGIAQSIKDMGNKAADAFADILVDGKTSFTGLVNAWLKDLARIEARKALDPLTNAAGGFIDRALGNLFGGSSLGRMPTPSIAEEFPAFATGGRFTVGGAGGTDSQLVAFRATPGERVTVETPAQQRGGQAMVFNIDARGADLGVAQRIEDGVRRAVALSVQAVAATADRGGGYARALGRR